MLEIRGLATSLFGGLVDRYAEYFGFVKDNLPSADIKLPFRTYVSWFFLLTMLHTIYVSGLLAVGEEKTYGKTMGLSGVLYLLLVTGGTLFFGILGAAAALVVSEGITLILLHERFKRFIRISAPPSTLLMVLAAVAMGVVIWLLPHVHILFTVFIGAIIYSLVVSVTRAITMADINSILRRI